LASPDRRIHLAACKPPVRTNAVLLYNFVMRLTSCVAVYDDRIVRTPEFNNRKLLLALFQHLRKLFDRVYGFSIDSLHDTVELAPGISIHGMRQVPSINNEVGYRAGVFLKA